MKHKKLGGYVTQTCQRASPTSWANPKCSSAAAPSSSAPNQPNPTGALGLRGLKLFPQTPNQLGQGQGELTPSVCLSSASCKPHRICSSPHSCPRRDFLEDRTQLPQLELLQHPGVKNEV